MPAPLPPYATPIPNGVELRLKVVPGSSRSTIVGPLGDRLKLKVAAPPEAGKANKEVVTLLRKWSGVKDVTVVGGLTHPEKIVHILNLDLATIQWPT